MPDLCPRCGATLPIIDGSSSPFCAVCGLPQLRVSEDVIVAPGSAVDGGDAAAGSSRSSASAGDVDWRRALPIALLASATALVPALFFPGALALGGAGSLCVVFAPLAALAAVHFYGQRHALFGARGGARIGAVTGLLLAAFVTAGSGIAGFILRYGRHSRELETLLTQNFDAGIAQFHPGTLAAAAPETLALLHSPEFRAGSYIAGQVLIGVIVLGLGALFGALGGALRRYRRQQLGR